MATPRPVWLPCCGCLPCLVWLATLTCLLSRTPLAASCRTTHSGVPTPGPGWPPPRRGSPSREPPESLDRGRIDRRLGLVDRLSKTTSRTGDTIRFEYDPDFLTGARR